MLAVAVNYIGAIKEKQFGPVFVKFFDDFKVVKPSPYGDLGKGRLQLCQPEEYEEALKGIQKYWDPTETFLELKGPKDKLQKVVRQMCFFDEEKKYEKVLLEGFDGITDFPWAVQIVMVQLPVLDWGQEPEWLRKADILILNDADRQESRDFLAKVKKARPGIEIFIEKVQEGLSKELKQCLETLFAEYLEKRRRIREVLEKQQSEQVISCEQAHRMAGKLKVSLFLFGNVCDECGYRVTRCRLGCF